MVIEESSSVSGLLETVAGPGHVLLLDAWGVLHSGVIFVRILIFNL